MPSGPAPVPVEWNLPSTRAKPRRAEPRRAKPRKVTLPMTVLPDKLKQLYEEAVGAGCETSRSKSGHIRLRTPGGPLVTGPSTASDIRSIDDTRADLRRAGMAV